MTPARWQQVKSVVEDAADEQDTRARAAFVERVCAGDPDLQREVESLLAHHSERLDEFAEDLRTSSVKHAESDAGRRVGAYRIVRELGRGGMGAVYLAERADERFRKRVAIKILKRGTDTDEVLRRFEAERQILAQLDHPNIARLLDAGTAEDGLPFFVMEYVDGASITKFCAAQNLSTRARVELFLRVCDAVQFAHRHLVVHRDIKPGNILVTAEGEPKLLDFGIAKLLAPDASTILLTAPQHQRLTPGYASPEQVRGETITTVSDVYSLGALLYELLSNRGPHEFPTDHPSTTDLLRIIVEQEPRRPSSATTAADTRRELRGDLDNILLTALRKEPGRRYSGVTAFADDLRRYLQDRPVRARRATFGYRASKFLARNKVAVAATALVLLATFAGATAYVLQTRRTAFHAQREAAHFRDLRKLANLFIFKYHDGIAALPGSTGLRKELVRDALDYLNNLAGKGTADPELLREIGTAYKRIADVQGGVLSSAKTGGTLSASNLGDTAGALENYRKALSIREQLAQVRPGDKATQFELAEIYINLGQISVVMGRPAEAAAHFAQAIRMLRRIVDKDPHDKLARAELRASYSALAQPLGLQTNNVGDTEGALEALRQGIAIGESLAAEEPENLAFRQGLAVSYGDAARLSLNSGRTADAVDYASKALAIGESLVAKNPQDPLYRRELAIQHRNVGGPLLQTGDAAGALKQFRQAVSIFEQLAKEDPNDARTRRSSAYAYRDLAEALAATGNRADAETNFRRALRIFEELAAKDSKNALLLTQQSITHSKMSSFFADGQDLPGAISSGQRAVEIAASLVAANRKDNGARKMLAESYAQLGRAFALRASSETASVDQQKQDWEQARLWYQKSQDTWSELTQQTRAGSADAEKRAAVVSALARCDAALAQLSSPSRAEP